MVLDKNIDIVDGADLNNETFFTSEEVKKGTILRSFDNVIRNYQYTHAKKQPSEWIYTLKGRHKNPDTEPVDYTETVQGYHFNFKDYGDVPLTQDRETAQKYAEEHNLDAVVLGFVNTKGEAQVAGVYIATDEPLRYNFAKELNKNTPEVDPTKFNISFRPVYTDVLYHGTGNKEFVSELVPNYIADPTISDCKATFFTPDSEYAESMANLRGGGIHNWTDGYINYTDDPEENERLNYFQGSMLETSLDWGDVDVIPYVTHESGWGHDTFRSICEMVRDAGYPAVYFRKRDDEKLPLELLVFDNDVVKVNIHRQYDPYDESPIKDTGRSEEIFKRLVDFKDQEREEYLATKTESDRIAIQKENMPLANMDVLRGINLRKPEIVFSRNKKRKPRPPRGFPKVPK